MNFDRKADRDRDPDPYRLRLPDVGMALAGLVLLTGGYLMGRADGSADAVRASGSQNTIPACARTMQEDEVVYPLDFGAGDKTIWGCEHREGNGWRR